jgi:hypothetical protein
MRIEESLQRRGKKRLAFFSMLIVVEALHRWVKNKKS